MASGSAYLLAAAALVITVAALHGPGQAAPTGAGMAAAAPAAALPKLVHPVDTFPICVEQRRCWRTDSGRRRCGEVTRCQECRYARQCDSQGCAWRQVCKWGPYKPILPTN